MKALSPAFWRGWLGRGLSGIDEEGRCSSSFLQGHPPSLRFGHPDVTYGRHRPSTHARLPEVARRVFRQAPSGCHTDALPQRSKERAERPGDGCPCVGAEETYGVPSQTLHEARGRTPPPSKPQSGGKHLLNETIRPPGSVPDQYAKPSPPGTDQPTHQPAHQRPGPAG